MHKCTADSGTDWLAADDDSSPDAGGARRKYYKYRCAPNFPLFLIIQLTYLLARKSCNSYLEIG